MVSPTCLLVLYMVRGLDGLTNLFTCTVHGEGLRRSHQPVYLYLMRRLDSLTDLFNCS